MKLLSKFNKYTIYQIDKKAAVVHAKTIASLANLIPLVDYTEKEILAESKLGRIFHGKWEHSLAAFCQDKIIAIIVGYEREKEDNDQYPENSLYISELAIDEKNRRQGLARELIKTFLDFNKSFFYLSGNLTYTVQTNSADWNQHVIDLYKSFGFKRTGFKKYDNRTDVILKLKSDQYLKSHQN